MGPLFPLDFIEPAWANVFALLIGLAFGFILESAGFSSSRKIIGVFYGYDFTVLRVFMTAAVVAMLGIIYFEYFGWLDVSRIFILPTYIYAVLLGGVIMGIGFLFGGYCPGTSVAGLAIGKIDALVYTIGMGVGVFIFAELFFLFEPIFSSGSMGKVLVYEYLGISKGLFAAIFTVCAVGAFIVAHFLEPKYANRRPE
jgi:hypothetical protein